MEELAQIITFFLWISIIAFFSFFAGHTVLDLIERFGVVFTSRRTDSSVTD